MPFIDKHQAFELLQDMIDGKCIERCRQVWLRNIGYALQTKTNPLQLTKAERTRMEKKLKEVKETKKATQTRKLKYKTRDSPPYPANEHCGERKKGNDGKFYTSVPNKNKICRWVLSTSL